MRQGQQNRRGRGNNNNRNRKSQNPLSRSFESNGPDVKIRGTPAHIAEKYLTLARDAQSSGDPVLAENYLQHAEHYSRIIMAYREQLQAQGGDMPNGNGQRMRGPDEGGEGDDFGDDDGGDDMLDDGFQQPPMPQHHQPHQGQQVRHSGYDANRDRPFRRDQSRFRDRDRPMIAAIAMIVEIVSARRSRTARLRLRRIVSLMPRWKPPAVVASRVAATASSSRMSSRNSCVARFVVAEPKAAASLPRRPRKSRATSTSCA